MIGKKAEEVLNRAVRQAFEKRHEYFTLEHVLLSLLDDPEILETIQACGGSYTKLKEELEKYLDNEVPKASREKSESDAGEDADPEEDAVLEHPVATLSIQRLIQRALFHVQSAGKDEIQPIDLFVALFQSKDSFALHLLRKQGIERIDVLNFVSHGVKKPEDEKDSDVKVNPSPSVEVQKNKKQNDILSTYTVCLNQLARDQKLDPLIGRKKELQRVVQTLCRRRKNNPLLVGEAGVGKTAIAEGLALRIEEEDVPKALLNAEVYSLDLGALLAGARFRGDFEQRLKKVLNTLISKGKKGVRPILFIDEIHTIIGAGAVSGGVLDAANLLKPFLSRGEVQCLGSTTYQEYRNVFEKDHALARRFQKIEIKEPTLEEAVQILNGLKEKFEEHHEVKYTPDAIRATVDLSSRHLTDRFLPDKAIDVLDEVGAKTNLSRKDGEETPMVDKPQVEDMIAEIARIPARSVSTSQKKRLRNIDRDLKLTIFGQDHAIDTIVSAIRMARSGLGSAEKPMGSFLFCGPTGVGKTELAKQLSHCLGVPFLRYDMSEYMEKHTISRLIGAPPGYVGFEQAGLLTEGVIKNPHAVILLDEIEKAHFDLNNILLQVMDHGSLTDNNGRKADFRNVILIMTSNVGSREAEKSPLGMNPGVEKRSVSKKAVEQWFSPEFRNRLDATVYFDSLDPVTVAQVVGKQLLELESQLLAKQVEIDLDSEVREWLAQRGYDPKMGARPMARLIQDMIKRPLSEEILFGKLEKGGKVRIRVKDNELDFSFESAPRSDQKQKEDVSASKEDGS